MKVAILGPVYTENYFGGVATFDENLAEGFRRIGHDVAIFSNQKDIARSSIKKTRDIKDEFDLVIASLTYIRFLGRFSKAKKVFFLHGFYYMPSHGMIKTFLALGYQKFFIKKYNATVIANSEFTRFMNFYAYNISAKGTVRLGCSYDFLNKISEYKKIISRKTKSILYVGRLIEAKKVACLIEAINFLDEEYTLTIIGDGPEKDKLVDLSKKYGINVVWKGAIKQEETVQYYLKSEVFVSLNPAEPFGITFCEALLCGCKIICPKTGGQVEFLKHFSDRVKMVEIGDIVGISEQISELCQGEFDDLPNVDQEQFTFERTAKEMLKIVDNVGENIC